VKSQREQHANMRLERVERPVVVFQKSSDSDRRDSEVTLFVKGYSQKMPLSRPRAQAFSRSRRALQPAGWANVFGSSSRNNMKKSDQNIIEK
jgi:hypothetical protein